MRGAVVPARSQLISDNKIAVFPGRITKSGGSVNVTGGAGRYAHARGTVGGEDLGGTRAINIYRLTLP